MEFKFPSGYLPLSETELGLEWGSLSGVTIKGKFKPPEFHSGLFLLYHIV